VAEEMSAWRRLAGLSIWRRGIGIERRRRQPGRGVEHKAAKDGMRKWRSAASSAKKTGEAIAAASLEKAAAKISNGGVNGEGGINRKKMA